MVRYQNLTRKPELFRAPLGPGPGTMYPLNHPLAGPACFYCWCNYCYLLMLVHITKILTLPFQVLAVLASNRQTNLLKQSFYFGYGTRKLVTSVLFYAPH